METFSFPSPRRSKHDSDALSSPSKHDSDALSSPISHIHSSSLDCFYSAPTSPSTTPIASSETNSDTDEFEFNTSSHYSKHQPPVMASECFHDNQLLPLKLPPRLQCPSPPLPPKTRGSIWKLRLSAFRFKNKEFDPFMEAIKRIRKEGMSRDRKPCHSRARSHDDRKFDSHVTGKAAGSKRDSHEGSKKPRKDDIIPFHGAPKGKGGVKDKATDHGDNCNARMVDIKEMRNRSLTRYKRSRTKFLSCFPFGPR